MATEQTLLDRIRMLEDRLDYLERGQAVGILGTDQTIKGSHDRLDNILGAGGSSWAYTRTFLVPAKAGYATSATEANAVAIVSPLGMRLTDGATRGCSNAFYLPTDWASGLTIKPLFIADNAGDLYFSAGCYHAAVGEAFTTHDDSAALAARAIAADVLATPLTITPANVAAGDLFVVGVERVGGNALDTVGDLVYCLGWIVSYTASR